MNGIEAVRTFFKDRIDGCVVAPFTDALTHVHGTMGFRVLEGESIHTIEVAYELLEPEETVLLEAYLEHVGLIELMRAIDEAAILVSPAGAHRIESHGPRGQAPGDDRTPEPAGSGPAPTVNESAKVRAYLIVENLPDLAEALGDVVRALGGMVLPAARIDEADRILADLWVDGIVVDLHLPDGDGLEWLESLVRREGGCDRRMVVCSGETLADQRLDGLERSGAVFLEKPFSLDACLQALGLDRESSRSGLARPSP